MCGIVGSIALNGRYRVDRALLRRMRDEMSHRGPDGSGVWVDERRQAGLGHRRLAIIDLSSAANQPMISADGRYILSYNGEIYNHQELRRQLQGQGETAWKTDHSDTEVLLRAFQHWGIDCLQHLRGMFAFAVWDTQERQLWLARDRIGIKPVYYSLLNDRFNFASEIKALLADPAQPRAVNEISLFHYFCYFTVPAPNTMFAGIHKLPGGCWLRLDANGQLKTQRWWDAWQHVQPMTDWSEQRIVERVRETLHTAVQRRKISDVPVGVFLSGGVDSSTNAALFSQGEKQPIKTFSIGYDQDYSTYQNELHYARQMADSIGAEHHELRLKLDDLLSFLPQMIHLQDEPIADPVCMPVYYVSKMAREHGVVVAQVGEGADELFWGYPSWKTSLRLQQMMDWLPAPLIKMGEWLLKQSPRGRQGLKREMLRRAGKGQPLFWSGVASVSDYRQRHILSADTRAKVQDITSFDALADIWQRFQSNAWEPSHLHWMTYNDLNLRLPELLLMRVDKMSMGVSLECRVPFLDHEFVELVLGIPSAMKTRGGVLKCTLKQAVRGLIPDNLIDRRKMGFGVPIHEWFLGTLGPFIKKEVFTLQKESGLLNPQYLETLFQGKTSLPLWLAFNFALWHKHFIQKKSISLL